MNQVANRLPSEDEYGQLRQLTIRTLPEISSTADERLAEVFAQCPQLEFVTLSGVPDTTDRTVVVLAQSAKNLQGLSLTNCTQISNIGVLEIADKCSNLQWLHLTGVAGLTDPSISAIAKSCAHLTELEACNLPLVTPLSVRDLWLYARNLRTLRLAHCPQLTDKAFPARAKATELRVEESELTGEKPLPHRPTTWIEGLPPLILRTTANSLRVLDLSYCSNVTDNAIEGIVAHAPRIQTFIASGCSSLTDTALESLSRLGHHLDVLMLAHVSKITDPALIQLIRACPNLRCIDVSFCRNLTDMSVFELAALSSLRRLSLLRVQKLTDIAVFAIAEHATQLERLNLSYCDNISLDAIHLLLRQLAGLQRLMASGIPSCHRKGLERFSEPQPHNYGQARTELWRVFSGKNIADLRNFLDKEEARRLEAEAKNIPFLPREDDSMELY